MKKKPKKVAPDLRKAMKGLAARSGPEVPRKDQIINLRVSSQQKDEINAAARELGMSVSAYLLELHGLAHEELRS